MPMPSTFSQISAAFSVAQIKYGSKRAATSMPKSVVLSGVLKLKRSLLSVTGSSALMHEASATRSFVLENCDFVSKSKKGCRDLKLVIICSSVGYCVSFTWKPNAAEMAC